MAEISARKCFQCGTMSCSPEVIAYTTVAEHDGQAYDIEVKNLTVLRCSSCGNVVLDDAANRKVSDAIRLAAGLLSPEQIHTHREKRKVSVKTLATFLEVTETTLLRWESGDQIQPRDRDRLLRRIWCI